MKKKVSLMIAIILIIQVLLPMLTVIWENNFTLISKAEEDTYEATVDGITWIYKLGDNNTKVYNLKPKNKNDSCTEIEIPNSINGCDVVKIGYNAFEGWKNLEKVTIPESVTIIDSSVFRSCSNLTSVNIPKGVTTIGAYAFYDCVKLDNIEIPDGVTVLGVNAFTDCKNLKNLKISNNLEKIMRSAFFRCSNLSNIELPKKLKTIEMSAFYECDSLTSVTIPDSVTSIGDYAFYYCSSLTSRKIPEGVISIGNRAFDGCENLTIYCKSNSYAKQYAVDNNIEYTIDDTAPTITSVEGNPSEWTKEDVTLTVTASDNLSGIKEYSFDGGETWQKENTKTYSQNTNGIVIKVRDNVGNEVESDPINITKIIKLEKGDANGDGKVDFKDMLAINKHRLKKKLLTGEKLIVADVNDDGEVDFKDMLKINKYRLGKINSL